MCSLLAQTYQLKRTNGKKSTKGKKTSTFKKTKTAAKPHLLPACYNSQTRENGQSSRWLVVYLAVDFAGYTDMQFATQFDRFVELIDQLSDYQLSQLARRVLLNKSVIEIALSARPPLTRGCFSVLQSQHTAVHTTAEARNVEKTISKSHQLHLLYLHAVTSRKHALVASSRLRVIRLMQCRTPGCD